MKLIDWYLNKNYIWTKKYEILLIINCCQSWSKIISHCVSKQNNKKKTKKFTILLNVFNLKMVVKSFGTIVCAKKGTVHQSISLFFYCVLCVCMFTNQKKYLLNGSTVNTQMNVSFYVTCDFQWSNWINLFKSNNYIWWLTKVNEIVMNWK